MTTLIDIVKNHQLNDDEKIAAIQNALHDGASIDEVDENGAGILHHCGRERCGLKLANWLLEQEPELLNVISKNGTNVLCYAASTSNDELISLFYERNPILAEQSNNYGQTIAHFAAYGQSISKYPLSECCKKFVNRIDAVGSCPLHQAAKTGHIDSIKWLIDNGAVVDQKTANKFDDTPVNICAYDDNLLALKLLHERGAAINQPNNMGIYPIHFAAAGGAVETLLWLLDQGIAIDLKQNNSTGDDLVHTASINQQRAILQLLKERGAPLDEFNKKGQRPVQYAQMNGDALTIKWFQDNGISVEQEVAETQH